MKIKETGELVGGYNPASWNIKGKPLNEEYWITTDKSFIFKINENQLNNSILSRVKDPHDAIFHPYQTCDFIDIDNINTTEINFGFNSYNIGNLQLHRSINNESYCYYNDPSNELNLNLRNYCYDYQLLEEYEVYKLIN